MQTAQTLAQLDAVLNEWRQQGMSWAFVPTMGALHEGHLTLVRAALAAYPRVVVSIFVNPTQFDRAADLERYPRQPQQDAEMLRAVGTHALFLPTVEVMYPNGTEPERLPDLAGLDQVYEGLARPGHFDGVVQVVRKLVQAVRPEAMFMGQKDAQQVAVLRRAALQEFWPVKILAVPIVREASGLAMSSRNGQLSPVGFAKAATINACLNEAQQRWQQGHPVRAIEASAKTQLSEAGLETEYFDFVDPETFEQLPDDANNSNAALIVTVAWIDGVRLIDNRPLPQR